MRNEYGNMLSCDRPLETRASLSVQNSLSLCSLEHLEFEFLEFVKLTVADQPRLAQLGGRPGTRPLIRAYLSLRLSSKNLTNDPCQSFGQKDWEFD
uniref:Nuclear pore protein n=1 Tax=Trichobilharzia regenti TaxID=157069 RepID=A0AA85J3L1_TRIRE